MRSNLLGAGVCYWCERFAVVAFKGKLVQTIRVIEPFSVYSVALGKLSLCGCRVCLTV